MMIPDKEFFDWIEAHIADDPKALRLKYSRKNLGFDVGFAILQIECRRKYASKLAGTLAAFRNFIFPTSLSGEQSTSDLLAEYHCSLTGNTGTVADLTAGLGIDATHFAAAGCDVTAVERIPELAEALKYNARGLNCDSLSVFTGDCREFISDAVSSGRIIDTCFIDPARRSADGGRVYALSDCEPDIARLIPDISKICRRLIIKMSPMLDISHTARELPRSPVSIISLGTPKECKELLAVIDFGAEDNTVPVIEATTLSGNKTTTLSFTATQERDAIPQTGGLPSAGDYIYEPFPAVIKSGAHRLLSERFGVMMFHSNTHLYHSSQLSDNFPGEAHRIISLMPYASKHIKRFKRDYPRISVCTRNFGISAEALKTKLGVADGGTLRVYGFTDAGGGRYLAVTE